MESSGLTLSLMTDIGSQSEWLPHSCHNVDLGEASELCGSYPPPIPGSLTAPTIRGDTNERKPFLPADHSDSAPSTLQELADSTLHRVGHAAEYFVVLIIQGSRSLSPIYRDTPPAFGKTRTPNVWESLSAKFAHAERHRLLVTVVVT